MRKRRALAALGGLLAAGAGLGLGELTAALAGGTSPVVGVGTQLIDLAPGAAKDWAVKNLGTADKPILIGVVLLAVAIFSLVASAIGATRPRIAIALTVLLGALAILAAATGRTLATNHFTQVLPAIITLLTATTGIVVVLRTLKPFGGSRHPEAPAAEGSNPPLATNTPTADGADPALATNAPADEGSESAPATNAPVAGGGKPTLRVGDSAPVAGAAASSDTARSAVGAEPAEAPSGFDRRAFLGTVMALGVAGAGGFGGSLVVPGGVSESTRRGIKLPMAASRARAVPAGVAADVSGVSKFFTPNPNFYRVDTLLTVPKVDPRNWQLRIHGMVDRELRLSFADLLDRRLIERDITLTCVSNEVGGPYVGNARWIGVPIAELLREAGVQGGADAVRSTSVDGLTIGTPLKALTDGRDAILAVGMNGEPLPFEHGFPVRMVVPGLYGFVSATKWLVDFEVTKFEDFSAYWTDRGWSVEAPIKTSSRIDVPRGFARIKAGPAVAAGVAWAQHRGITKVEVQVDDNDWLPATLAAEDSIDTWRQWTFRWDATPGNHTLTVRATDATGQVQTADRAAPRPNGSSGLHNTVVMVE
ncbi:molybdopterin-dependent oxidoreductase [Kribbella sp. NBC_00382]|uniref:molybdopterin-dependent oxidoreductase n=1 Tax=Kribbella sp. NBC_00382 TaxID=2975967 RepID=UPI002E1AAEE4